MRLERRCTAKRKFCYNEMEKKYVAVVGCQQWCQNFETFNL